MMKNNSFKPFTLCCGSRLLSFDRPAVMGILNVTDDSFYDGGRYRGRDQYLLRASEMAADGADIIDIGAVSTRPGAQLLDPVVEAQRLSEVVKDVRNLLPDAVISVDTCFSVPARAAVEAGADIVNDISGGSFDSLMFETVAELNTPYVLMHNLSTPDHMQDNPQYEDILKDVVLFFSQRLEKLYRLGVKDVVIDPGFGFSKTLDHNYQLFSRIGQIKDLFPNEPLMVAISRKSMIYKLLETTPEDALIGTTALHAAALLSGAQMLRVHDVRAALQVVKTISRLTNQ